MCRKIDDNISPMPAAAPSKPATTTTVASGNSTMTKRVRIVVVVSGLLLAEYFLQSLYYERTRQQDLASRWFNKNSVVVPKSDVASLGLGTCKFPIFYDKSRYNFRLDDDAIIQPGRWREKNKRFVGDEDARVVYNSLKWAEKVRKKMFNRNPELPRLTRNLTYVHIGKAG